MALLGNGKGQRKKEKKTKAVVFGLNAAVLENSIRLVVHHMLGRVARHIIRLVHHYRRLNRPRDPVRLRGLGQVNVGPVAPFAVWRLLDRF